MVERYDIKKNEWKSIQIYLNLDSEAADGSQFVFYPAMAGAQINTTSMLVKLSREIL